MLRRKINLFVLVLLGAVALFSAPRAHAEDRQVWRSTNGNIVHDRLSGTCVRQNSAVMDPCGAPEKLRTVIAEEERTVYFDFNKAQLTPSAKARLNALATKLKSAQDIQGANVAGYADRIGSVSYNESLSKKRAKAVRDYLVSRKVVNANIVSTRWFGKTEPSTQCPDTLKRAELIQCLQPDRKVQVDIVYRKDVAVPAAPAEE